MNPDQKFWQRWEYRRKDDDVDSSSNDTKSNSGDKPVQKQHGVLLDLIRKDENDSSRSVQSNQLNIITAIPLQIAEANNMHFGLGKKRISVANGSKGNSRKKRKREVMLAKEPAQLADLKTFTNSLLKEIKVARDTMFVRMKRQITKMTSVKSALRTKSKEGKSDKAIHQNETESGMKTENCYGGLIEMPKKNSKTFGSSKYLNAIEKRRNHEQASVASGMEKIEDPSLPMKKPISDSDQTASFSYLPLPGILSKPQTENSRTEFSSSDHIHAGYAITRTNILESEKFLTDAQSHHGYLPSILPDEQFGSVSQMGSKSMGQQSIKTPSMNPGLQVPPHQWSNNCFGFASQIVLEIPGQETGSAFLRMNSGGMSFPGSSHALSEASVTTINCNMKNDTDAGLLSFRSQDIKREYIFPK